MPVTLLDRHGVFSMTKGSVKMTRQTLRIARTILPPVKINVVQVISESNASQPRNVKTKAKKFPHVLCRSSNEVEAALADVSVDVSKPRILTITNTTACKEEVRLTRY
jgi:hypothetical protein